MLSVIIPVRDEPNLDKTLYEVHETLSGIPDSYEVLIVQGDREKGKYPFNHVLPHQRVVKTYGDSLERSILNGFSQAQGNKIVVMDADGSHPPHMIVDMWKSLDEWELVVGSRFVEGSKFTASPLRLVVTYLCVWFARDSGSKLKDPMSGFFGVNREVVERIQFKPLTWKTALEIELLGKPKVVELPIEFNERLAGKSKTSLKVGLKILWQLYWMGFL